MVILAIALLTGLFLSFLFGRIGATPTARAVFSRLAITLTFAVAFLVLFGPLKAKLICMHLVAAITLSDFVARPILRQRVIPPCVRVSRLGERILGIVMLVPMPFVFIDFYFEGHFSRWQGPAALSMLISVTAFLILFSFQRSEICANGLWYNGMLYEWDACESSSWTPQDGQLIVDLKFGKRRNQMHLVVPPENREAARQLLEANLSNRHTAGQR